MGPKRSIRSIVLTYPFRNSSTVTPTVSPHSDKLTNSERVTEQTVATPVEPQINVWDEGVKLCSPAPGSCRTQTVLLYKETINMTHQLRAALHYASSVRAANITFFERCRKIKVIVAQLLWECIFLIPWLGLYKINLNPTLNNTQKWFHNEPSMALPDYGLVESFLCIFLSEVMPDLHQ